MAPGQPARRLLPAFGLHCARRTVEAVLLLGCTSARFSAFLVYIPGSKHRHMFLAAPNVYFRKPLAEGRAAARIPSARTPASSTIEQFDWKQKLDLYSLHRMRPLPGGLPRLRSGPAAQPEDS